MSTLVIGTVKSNSSSPPTFQDTSGTEIGTLCRAWVNFNGTGTVAVRAQFNVSSITDNGVGDYTVNFTNALADTSYSVTGIVRFTANGSITLGGATGSTTWQQTGSVRLQVLTTPGGLTDAEYVNTAIFR